MTVTRQTGRLTLPSGSVNTTLRDATLAAQALDRDDWDELVAAIAICVNAWLHSIVKLRSGPGPESRRRVRQPPRERVLALAAGRRLAAAANAGWALSAPLCCLVAFRGRICAYLLPKGGSLWWQVGETVGADLAPDLR
jgi:hypothetical protein